MKRFTALTIFALYLACCAVRSPAPIVGAPTPQASSTEVQILAINDFHGNLEPPKFTIEAPGPDGATARVPAGGAAHLVSAAKSLRQGHPYTITVSAGGIIGARPFGPGPYPREPPLPSLDPLGVPPYFLANHDVHKGP